MLDRRRWLRIGVIIVVLSVSAGYLLHFDFKQQIMVAISEPAAQRLNLGFIKGVWITPWEVRSTLENDAEKLGELLRCGLR